ncbi:MAG: hypothetical protein ABW189_02180 [Rickettsiales bacterium]
MASYSGKPHDLQAYLPKKSSGGYCCLIDESCGSDEWRHAVAGNIARYLITIGRVDKSELGEVELPDSENSALPRTFFENMSLLWEQYGPSSGNHYCVIAFPPWQPSEDERSGFLKLLQQIEKANKEGAFHISMAEGFDDEQPWFKDFVSTLEQSSAVSVVPLQVFRPFFPSEVKIAPQEAAISAVIEEKAPAAPIEEEEEQPVIDDNASHDVTKRSNHDMLRLLKKANPATPFKRRWYSGTRILRTVLRGPNLFDRGALGITGLVISQSALQKKSKDKTSRALTVLS